MYNYICVYIYVDIDVGIDINIDIYVCMDIYIYRLTRGTAYRQSQRYQHGYR